MAPAAPKRILIAEDNKAIRNILAFMLRHRGYEVTESADGEDALEQALSRRPDLVVLDVMLPGKSGFEICSILKGNEHTRGIRLLILTAATKDSGQDDAHWRRITNTDDFVSKPFKAPDLIRRIETLLDGGGELETRSLRDLPFDLKSDSEGL